MKFAIKKRYGFSVVVESDNASIEEDVNETVYAVVDGKKDYSKRLGERINKDFLGTLENLATEVFSFDKEEFDSSVLMEVLFDKLPADKKRKFAAYAARETEDEE